MEIKDMPKTIKEDVKLEDPKPTELDPTNPRPITQRKDRIDGKNIKYVKKTTILVRKAITTYQEEEVEFELFNSWDEIQKRIELLALSEGSEVILHDDVNKNLYEYKVTGDGGYRMSKLKLPDGDE